eukprot:3941957-Rhodomonas_salina.3
MPDISVQCRISVPYCVLPYTISVPYCVLPYAISVLFECGQLVPGKASSSLLSGGGQTCPLSLIHISEPTRPRLISTIRYLSTVCNVGRSQHTLCQYRTLHSRRVGGKCETCASAREPRWLCSSIRYLSTAHRLAAYAISVPHIT